VSQIFVWDGLTAFEGFVPPGRYTAFVCANTPGPELTCGPATFDYPTDEAVALTLPTPEELSPDHLSCASTLRPCVVGAEWCDAGSGAGSGSCLSLPEECRTDPCACFSPGNVYRPTAEGHTLVDECRVDENGGVYV